MSTDTVDTKPDADGGTDELVSRLYPSISRSISLKGLRGSIASHMKSSLADSAQLTLTSEVDVTGLVRSRDENRASHPVSYNVLLMRACALTLAHHPRLNAIIHDRQILECDDINMGLAVAVPDGLIVPVVPNVANRTLNEVAVDTEAAIAKVKAGRITPDLISGGTFTVSNLGAFGIDAFTPIINPPQVAILGVGRIKTFQAVTGVQHSMWLSLTIDHRAVDGVPGAEFLKDLSSVLLEPDDLFD